jgi:hypothetical protein
MYNNGRYDVFRRLLHCVVFIKNNHFISTCCDAIVIVVCDISNALFTLLWIRTFADCSTCFLCRRLQSRQHDWLCTDKKCGCSHIHLMVIGTQTHYSLVMVAVMEHCNASFAPH